MEGHTPEQIGNSNPNPPWQAMEKCWWSEANKVFVAGFLCVCIFFGGGLIASAPLLPFRCCGRIRCCCFLPVSLCCVPSFFSLLSPFLLVSASSSFLVCGCCPRATGKGFHYSNNTNTTSSNNHSTEERKKPGTVIQTLKKHKRT